LIQFADNCLGESQNFNNDNERLLYNLLRFVDNYTNLGILSETGLASL
jgi:hypothetical protein